MNTCPDHQNDHGFASQAHPAIRVDVERAAGQSPQVISADLLDLSPGGAKLSTRSAVSFQESVILKLENILASQQLCIESQVQWIRRGPPGTWILGCSFDRSLAADQFESLSAVSFVERRRSRRKANATHGTVDWELGERDIPVELQNLSKGGFCIKAPRAGKTAGRLHLAVNAGAQGRCRVRATARWQLPHDNSYLIGCEFVDAASYQNLREALRLDQAKAEIRQARQRRISTLALLGIVAFLYWLWAFYF